MFLALNEMKEAKLKYSLITGLLLLIAYLMFFLSGLANGLVQENKSAIDYWKADLVFLAKDANATLNLSQIPKDKKKQIDATKITSLRQFNTVAWTKVKPNEEDKQKVSLFGIEANSFLLPPLLKGRTLKGQNEALIDKSLADKSGFELGDHIQFLNQDKTVKIVGITNKATFNVSPVIYMSQETFKPFMRPSKTGDMLVNAFIVQGKVDNYPKSDFQKLSLESFITKLPGYNAQVLTFAFMIGFLILISAIIISIFMYVLTIQKAPIFGIMKAQGISNKVIANALLTQTFLLSIIGSSAGWLLTGLTALLLPKAVPFQGNLGLDSLIFTSLILCALLGTLFSVLATVRIDPLKAIG
ncbi:ABC transporter permease [Streptococcus iniae]